MEARCESFCEYRRGQFEQGNPANELSDAFAVRLIIPPGRWSKDKPLFDRGPRQGLRSSGLLSGSFLRSYAISAVGHLDV
jgi:hypothetical protein